MNQVAVNGNNLVTCGLTAVTFNIPAKFHESTGMRLATNRDVKPHWSANEQICGITRFTLLLTLCRRNHQGSSANRIVNSGRSITLSAVLFTQHGVRI
jgi:hypothetical protein